MIFIMCLFLVTSDLGKKMSNLDISVISVRNFCFAFKPFVYLFWSFTVINGSDVHDMHVCGDREQQHVLFSSYIQLVLQQRGVLLEIPQRGVLLFCKLQRVLHGVYVLETLEHEQDEFYSELVFFQSMFLHGEP